MSKFMNAPADDAVLADIAKQEAEGGDPFGDNEEIVPETIADQAARAAAESGETADETAAEAGETTPEADESAETTAEAEAETETEAEAKPDLEALAEIAGEPKPEPAPAPPPRFNTPDLAALNAKRDELNEKLDAAFAKVMAGDIEAPAYSALRRDIQGQLDDLTAARTLLQANQQTEIITEQQALTAVMKSAKAAGEVDYVADVEAQDQFDIALNMLKASPANRGKSITEITEKAHKAVLAMRGVTPKSAAAPAPTPPPPEPLKPRVAPPGPPTLRGLPEAASTLSGGDKYDAMGRKSGADFEADWAKLSPAEKAALVDG